MNYLSVEEVSKSYGPKVLFNKISFGIDRGWKIALIAKNGAGKSTLMKIISGLEQPDSGKVVFRNGIIVSFLEQEPHFNESSTVLETIFEIDTPTTRAVKEYEHCLALVEKDGSDINNEKLQNAMTEMEHQNAWDYEVRAKQILTELSITDMELPISSLSGGQRKRVALSKVLLANPDLLIMDEPTNHLDLDMIEWLEGYLASKDMALLLVTHDRYFLDSVCEKIIELEDGKLYHYDGNFSYYLEKKAERQQMENSVLDKVRNLYVRELEWVRKSPRARGVKQKARTDAFDDIKEKALAKKNRDQLQLGVQMSRMGGKILELVNVNKSYGDLKILDKFSYVFKKGEKIGIIGRNGVGKSTFLNIIQSLEKYDSGKLQTGETIIFGYYSQQGMKLKEDKRVIEVVKEIAEFIPMSDGTKLSASQLLQRFLFDGDMQYSFVSKLSGGEKRRLYLLTVLVRNPNFLILDEPTNDLDIISLAVLEDFLTEYTGCVLIVSHDRYFMDKLVDHLFIFKGAGIIKDYPGNYTLYRDSPDWQTTRQMEQEVAEIKAAEKKVVVEKTPEVSKRRMNFKEKSEFESLEKEIPQLETEKANLTEKLSSGISDHTEIAKISGRLEEIISQLDAKSVRWLELSEIF